MIFVLVILRSDDHINQSLESHALPNHFGIVLRITDEEIPCAFNCSYFQISPSTANYTIESLSILPQACLLHTAASDGLVVQYHCKCMNNEGTFSSFVSNRLQVFMSDEGGTNVVCP